MRTPRPGAVTGGLLTGKPHPASIRNCVHPENVTMAACLLILG